jgi:hypothetical protein
MRQIGNTEAEDRCYQIRMRAQRKADELSKQIEKGTPRSLSPAGGLKEDTLRAAGIPKQRASEWERLSEVPDAEFEAAFADNPRPSIDFIIGKKPTPVSDDALLFIGTIRDFERRGYLARSPADFMETMTPTMIAEVRRIAPLASEWLARVGNDND